ncbi:hypothetical protein CR513_54747, partial [Mucuna pruriens]
MPSSECTIALQDVVMQLGLRVDGNQLLVLQTVIEEIIDSRLKMTWLEEYFGNVAKHAHNMLQMIQFKRAYILRLIRGMLLPYHYGVFTYNDVVDTVGDQLANLHRKLCLATNIEHKKISGACLLI